MEAKINKISKTIENQGTTFWECVCTPGDAQALTPGSVSMSSGITRGGAHQAISSALCQFLGWHSERQTPYPLC